MAECTVNTNSMNSMEIYCLHASQEFHDVKFEMRYLVRVLAVKYSAQFVNRAQRSRTVCELRKGQPHERKFPHRCGGEKIQTKV